MLLIATRLSLVVVFCVLLAHAVGPPATAAPSTRVQESAPRAAEPILYFPETGFAVDEPRILEYFIRRGNVRAFGYPTSRTMLFLGRQSQFFQRAVLQIDAEGSVRPLNLLGDEYLGLDDLSALAIPPVDADIVAATPNPSNPGYSRAVTEFVRRYAPEAFDERPVRFFSTFAGAVTLADAFPGGSGDPTLLPLLNLEVWGFPTSVPTRVPGGVALRFQRGIMHYADECDCTRAMLLADVLKSALMGTSPYAELTSATSARRYFRQLSATSPIGVERPDDLPDTILTDAFEPIARGVIDAAARSAPPAGSYRSRVRAEADLLTAIDALEWAGRRELLDVLAESQLEVSFGDLPERIRGRYLRDATRPLERPERRIVINSSLRGADPAILATLVSHEAAHARDDLQGRYREELEACIDFEGRALREQALVWRTLAGPRGRQPAASDVEDELNEWLRLTADSGDAFESRVRRLYLASCLEVERSRTTR